MYCTAEIKLDWIEWNGDLILITGISLFNYMKNPIILWEHDLGRMVGRLNSTSVNADLNRLFAQIHLHENAPSVRQLRILSDALAQTGQYLPLFPGYILKSYGGPTQEEIRDNPEWARARRIIRACELVELSVSLNFDGSVLPEALEIKGDTDLKPLLKPIPEIHFFLQPSLPKPADLETAAEQFDPFSGIGIVPCFKPCNCGAVKSNQPGHYHWCECLEAAKQHWKVRYAYRFENELVCCLDIEEQQMGWCTGRMEELVDEIEARVDSQTVYYRFPYGSEPVTRQEWFR